MQQNNGGDQKRIWRDSFHFVQHKYAMHIMHDSINLRKDTCICRDVAMRMINEEDINFLQVVMGYGHNKLSLEEAEELLKEVNHSQ